MATIEYITKRVEGKEKELTKLRNKLARIEKAESTNWEANPYCYSEDDKRWTLKDIENAEAALAKYRDELEKATEKANSRNVTAIIEFLNGWKTRVRAYYVASFEQYKIAEADWDRKQAEYSEKRRNMSALSPEWKAAYAEYKEAAAAFQTEWRFLTPYITRELNAAKTERVLVLDTAKLDKDLNDDANAMYDEIIERTNKVTGKITDASGLEVGAKGELNGFIVGERGTAKVQTIGAGGYNIQRFHFRTLIHAI